MTSLITASLGRKRTVLMVFIFLIVSGFLTYQSIPKEADPDVEIPFIYVSIGHDGISPQDAERLLVRPMENQLKTITGIKEMKSTASEGHASIVMEFVAGFDSKEALADVRDRVSIAGSELPADTDEPTVHEVTLAEENPVITITLSGNAPERALLKIARNLSDAIETLKEVLSVEIGGDREDMLEVIVDPLAMESYQLDPAEIFGSISRNNRLVAAGTLDSGHGRYAVKIPSIFDSLDDILNLPVKTVGDRAVYFRDVSEVRRSFTDPESFVSLNGQQAVSLEVKKRPGENIIETVANVRNLIEQAKQLWPEHIIVTFSGDQSEDVEMMLTDLQNNVISAVILVVIVIIATLGVRAAALVGLSIPGSFLTGILALAIMGYTINIVVLFALIMAVGMLVDGAIVVTEYADRKMSEGIARQEAYHQAAMRMAWPIIASTATTLAAFAPLLFWPGIMGEFMKYLPITLIVTLAASLVMALVFLPTMGSIFGAPRPMSDITKANLKQTETGDILSLGGMTGSYVRVLHQATQNPVQVLFVALVFAIAVFFAYGKSGLGMEFFPEVEPPGGNLTVKGYGDLSIAEKDNLMKEVESRLHDMPEIETLYTRSGGQDMIGSMRFNLIDWQQRRKAKEIIKEIEKRLDDMAGVEIEIRKDEAGMPAGKDLVIELNSKFSGSLSEVARIIRSELEANPDFINVDDSLPKPGIEWKLEVDTANAARYGADASLVGQMVQMVTSGLVVGSFRPDDVDDELDIRVRYPEEKRNLNRLDHLRIQTSYGLIPISNFVNRVAVQKVDTIMRVDNHKVIQVEADTAEGVLLDQALEKLKAKLPELKLDPRVKFAIKGQNQEEQQSKEFLQKAFAIALFIMLIILVTQFNSIFQALLILSAVMFSTVGVFLGLLVFQKPFGLVMSGIGVIALAGIVVNNNIVLIDTYNRLKQDGMDAYEAIMRAGAQRLRPVLLTTVTTILGLLPMVLETNIDIIGRNIEVGGPSTQWWSQLATAIAGGLAFATVLTLILTPCALAIAESVSRTVSDKMINNKLNLDDI